MSVGPMTSEERLQAAIRCEPSDRVPVAPMIYYFAAFYAGLGGWLAIAPTATAQYFGTKFSSRNYGILFLAYGVGAIIATFVAAYSRDIFKGSTFDMFIPVAILAALAFVLAAFFMKPPKQAEAAKK